MIDEEALKMSLLNSLHYWNLKLNTDQGKKKSYLKCDRDTRIFWKTASDNSAAPLDLAFRAVWSIQVTQQLSGG